MKRTQLTNVTRNEEIASEVGNLLLHLVVRFQLRFGAHIIVGPRPSGIMPDAFQEALRRGARLAIRELCSIGTSKLLFDRRILRRLLRISAGRHCVWSLLV